MSLAQIVLFFFSFLAHVGAQAEWCDIIICSRVLQSTACESVIPDPLHVLNVKTREEALPCVQSSKGNVGAGGR